MPIEGFARTPKHPVTPPIPPAPGRAVQANGGMPRQDVYTVDDLQATQRHPPRPGSPSLDFNQTVAGKTGTPTFERRFEMEPAGTVEGNGLTLGSQKLLQAQLKEQNRLDSFAAMADFRDGRIGAEEFRRRMDVIGHREGANVFGLDKNDPGRVVALGTGPGVGGLHVGMNDVDVRFPIRDAINPQALQAWHTHPRPQPGYVNNFFSAQDKVIASACNGKGMPAIGVVTYGTPRWPSKNGEERFLTDGQVKTTRPDGTMDWADQPPVYKVKDNPGIEVGAPAKDFRSIAFGLRPGPDTETRPTGNPAPGTGSG